jgi:hypothetical protein
VTAHKTKNPGESQKSRGFLLTNVRRAHYAFTLAIVFMIEASLLRRIMKLLIFESESQKSGGVKAC